MATAKNLIDRLYRKGIKISKSAIEEIVASMSSTGEVTDEQADAIIEQIVNKEKTIAPIEAGVTSQEPRQIDTLIPYTPVNNEISKEQSSQIVFGQVTALKLDLKVSEISAISEKLYEQKLTNENAVTYAIDLILDYVNRDEENYVARLTNSTRLAVEHINKSYERRNQLTNETFTRLATEVRESADSYKSSCDNFKTELEQYFEGARARLERDN